MSLRVFVEIGGLDVRQQHGDPAGVPVGALWCSDAGCWLREFKDDEAAERMARRRLLAQEQGSGVDWDDLSPTEQAWYINEATTDLLAAVGGEGQ